MSDFIIEAQRVLRENGIDPGGTLDTSGTLVRCGTTGKPHGKNGAYILHIDAPASLWWQNWATSESGSHSAKAENTLSSAERKALRERITTDRAAREAEQQARHAEAAQKADCIWEAAPAADDSHPYLVRKEVPFFGLRLARDGRLMVPMRNAHGKVQSLQFIDADGGKRFLPGGKKGGAFYSIPAKDGSKVGPLLIAEGFATAASLHMATGYAVLVAFDAGNLMPVACMARTHYPEREIIVCADNDVRDNDVDATGKPQPNTGVVKATEAASAIAGKLAIPPAHEGRKTDYNDLHHARGLDAVRVSVEGATLSDVDVAGQGAEGAEPSLPSPVLPPPPSVPLKAFPLQIQSLLLEASAAFAVPTQVPATVLLALVSCLVGRTRAVEAKPGWREHGNIWLVLVAPSGLGKTPVSHAFFRPIEEREYKLYLEWKKDFEAYSQELLDFGKTKKSERGAAPQMPPRVQHYLDDSTVEALADALNQNPRGITWRVDELSGLLASFDKYSSSGKEGGTRARLLSAHDCQSWKSNRRDAGRNLHIPAACVSIFGGLQPGMLGRTFDGGDQDSGFLPRFMFIRAEREKPALWSEAALSSASEILLRKVVDSLAAFRLVTREDGRETPAVAPLTPEAKAAFVKWHDALALEGWACLAEGTAEAILQKLKSHALRLCLLLHCLDAALEGREGIEPIPVTTMHRALMLADWVKAHQRQTYKLFSSGQVRASNPIEQAIMMSVVFEEAAIVKAGGKITNARLVELVNERSPVTVKPEVVGKAATSLGMPVAYVGKERARQVLSEKMALFKATVGTVGTVGEPTGALSYSHRQLKNELSELSELSAGATDPLLLPTVMALPTVVNDYTSPPDTSLVALAVACGFQYDPTADEVTL